MFELLSKWNRTLYKMLAAAKNTSSATIERVGDQGAVIVKVSRANKYEDWIFKEFAETKTAQAYLRTCGRIEQGERIEEKNWYRPADDELAWDFDIGAAAHLERFFPSTRAISEPEE